MSLFDQIEPQLREAEQRYEELERRMGDPAVATDAAKLQKLLIERGRLEATVGPYREVRKARLELEEARGEREAAREPDMRALCDEVIGELEERLPRMEEEMLRAFVTDEDDAVPEAIVEIRAGTGGEEARLWAADLMRMYLRFCDRRGFKTELLEEVRTGDGVKEVVLGVSGPGAYAALKFESGGHRVQRVPATEASGRIHTSAATVAVLLQPSEVEVEIADADLKIDTYRSSGPGGQKVNKTDSAIRVTHVPTGLVVTCQDEKSQHKNKSKALRILRSRLYDLERSRQQAERASARRSLIGTGDRSERIRTYNFPQSRVTDHRIGYTAHNLREVLDGDLDALIESLAKHEQERRLQDLVTRI